MFPRSSGYALLALTHLASQPSGRLVGARQIASAANIPAPFLWKVLRDLSRRKLVRSFKGVRGGYELAKSAERITVLEVIEKTAAHDRNRCTLGLPTCTEQRPCPLDAAWKACRSEMLASLRTLTVADVAAHYRPASHRSAGLSQR
jgi:Rrf2 family protein